METLNATDPAALPAGTLVGRWRVVSRRGSGSYGVVYRTVLAEASEERPFALKLALHPLDPRFEREGELLLRIHHPHVPHLEERGWVMLRGGVPFPYLVMEWVEGVTLYEWAGMQPRSHRQVLGLLAQVARALAATHAEEGVHRDVKGHNVLVRAEDGRAVLMDFGSGNFRGARVLTWQQPPPGTPQYQSPESLRFQWENLRNPTARYDAGPADDVYALGVTAYRLVTGSYPNNPPVEVPAQTQASMFPELAALLQQMLSIEPSARGSAAEVAEALERATKTAGPRADELLPRPPAPELPARKARTASARHTPSGSPRYALAASVSLALSAWWAWNEPGGEQPAKVAQHARDDGSEDSELVGLAESVRAIPVSMEQPEARRSGIGLELPKKPFPGQRRPPCEKPEVEINGGCWVSLDATPPCGARSYEWKDGCYSPILAPSGPATSDPSSK